MGEADGAVGEAGEGVGHEAGAVVDPRLVADQGSHRIERGVGEIALTMQVEVVARGGHALEGVEQPHGGAVRFACARARLDQPAQHQRGAALEHAGFPHFATQSTRLLEGGLEHPQPVARDQGEPPLGEQGGDEILDQVRFHPRLERRPGVGVGRVEILVGDRR